MRMDDSGLRKMLLAMGGGHHVLIGVFGGAPHKEAGAKYVTRGKGDESRRTKKQNSGMTNAEVGFINEFGRPSIDGKPKIPARSWLRMPIMTKINQIVKDSARYFQDAVKEGDSIKFLTVLGINCEKWIQLAFDTRGFGSWAPNAPLTIHIKGSDAPLIDTAQLRRSVTSIVV